jgi:Fe-S-cluster containining protein
MRIQPKSHVTKSGKVVNGRQSVFLDSIDKAVMMLSTVTRVPFQYKGADFQPVTMLCVSDGVFNRAYCPSGCGACCSKSWTLDWLPGEEPYETEKRLIDFDAGGKEVYIMTDWQKGRDKLSPCQHRSPTTGFCGIHQAPHPMTCDLPMLEFHPRHGATGRAHIMFKKFGRSWAMKRVDTGGGADCPIVRDRTGGAESLRKFKRLLDWANHFGLERTWLPDIITWIETGPHDGHLYLDARQGLFNTPDVLKSLADR